MRVGEGGSGNGENPERRARRVVASPTRVIPRPRPSIFAKPAQALALLLAAFLLLRVVGPWLIDLHNTPALILAVVLLVFGLFAIAWFAWALVVSFLRKG